MGERPERFSVRSRVLLDSELSHGAVRLLLILDDQAWGEDSIAIHQKKLAKLLKLDIRTVRDLLGELCRRAYISKRRTLSGANMYEFIRQKTARLERQKATGQSGRKQPDLPIRQETTRTPTPLDWKHEETGEGNLRWFLADQPGVFYSTDQTVELEIARAGGHYCVDGIRRTGEYCGCDKGRARADLDAAISRPRKRWARSA